MNKQSAWRLTLLITLTGALLALTAARAAKQNDAFSQLDLLVEVRHELVETYVDQPDQTKLIESAVQGMVRSLRDPYTVYVPAEELEQFEDRLTGSFSGIGAEIDVQDGRPRIVTPLEDSPAWKAGVMAGDLILKVDGETTRDKSLMKIIKKIKGEVGTPVTLTVRRESGEELDITITRAQISVQTVRGARRKADQSFDFMLDPANKVGCVRISQFTDKTTDDLRSALEELKQQDVRGIILDLRFDPGGLLNTAVKVSNMFLPGGKRIVSTKGRAWPEQVFDSTDDTVMPDIPMVVLANEGSASASEVVTGALSDNKRALFVGTRTFGKGSVQQIRGLDSGQGALKITGAYYYLPNGRNIHRKPDAEVWGVDPDKGAYVPMTSKQYEQMVKARRSADTLSLENGHDDGAEVTPRWIDQTMKDPQLAAALTAVLGKIDTGDWPSVGQSNAQKLVHQRERELLKRRRGLLLEELHRVEDELADSDKPSQAQADDTSADTQDARAADTSVTTGHQAEQAKTKQPPRTQEQVQPQAQEQTQEQAPTLAGVAEPQAEHVPAQPEHAPNPDTAAQPQPAEQP